MYPQSGEVVGQTIVKMLPYGAGRDFRRDLDKIPRGKDVALPLEQWAKEHNGKPPGWNVPRSVEKAVPYIPKRYQRPEQQD